MRYSAETFRHTSTPATFISSLWPFWSIPLFVASGSVVVYVLRYSSFGYDFTDEGYYLNVISDPTRWDWTYTFFGYIYNPLYVSLGQDVATLRAVNVVLTFTLSWFVALGLLSALLRPKSGEYLFASAVSAGLATSSLVMFDAWLVTPNYNTLSFQGLLLVALGLFSLQPVQNQSVNVRPWLLIGCGGWVVFMAKPSSAAAVALLALMYLLLSRKLSVKGVALAIFVSFFLVVVTALIWDKSLFSFFGKLFLSIEMLQSLDAGYGVGNAFRIDEIYLPQAYLAFFLFVLMLTAVLAWLSFQRVVVVRVTLAIAFGLLVFATVCSLWLGDYPSQQSSYFRRLVLLFAPFAALIVLISSLAYGFFHNGKWQQLLDASTLLLLPMVHAFGSNLNYWPVAGGGGYFWVLSGAIFFGGWCKSPQNRKSLLILAAMVPFVTATLLKEAINSPYRQPNNLMQNATSVQFGGASSELILSAAHAAYIKEARVAVAAAINDEKISVIDLTGRSPGLLFALGMDPVGAPWFIGGYRGSTVMGAKALQLEGCEKLAEAWLLREPFGGYRIDDSVLLSQGLSIGDYEFAVSWSTRPLVGGDPRILEQSLYRPIDRRSIQNKCESSRH